MANESEECIEALGAEKKGLKGKLSVSNRNQNEHKRQSFPQEISMLQEGASCVRKGSSICRLDPVLDGGILRVGGWLRRSAMPEERKHPAILAKVHQCALTFTKGTVLYERLFS